MNRAARRAKRSGKMPAHRQTHVPGREVRWIVASERQQDKPTSENEQKASRAHE